MSNYPKTVPAHLVAFGRKYMEMIYSYGWLGGTDGNGHTRRFVVFKGPITSLIPDAAVFSTNDIYELRIWMDSNGLGVGKHYMDFGWKLGDGRIAVKKVNLAYRNDLP